MSDFILKTEEEEKKKKMVSLHKLLQMMCEFQ